MSWQAYVDNNLVGTGAVSQAAIVGHDGSVWAKSAELNISKAEAQAIIRGFTDPSGLRAGGIIIGGEKYMCLNANERSIYGKKGAGGVVCVKTGQCVLIAIYKEGQQPGNATNTVEKLADYLIESGF